MTPSMSLESLFPFIKPKNKIRKRSKKLWRRFFISSYLSIRKFSMELFKKGGQCIIYTVLLALGKQSGKHLVRTSFIFGARFVTKHKRFMSDIHGCEKFSPYTVQIFQVEKFLSFNALEFVFSWFL